MSFKQGLRAVFIQSVPELTLDGAETTAFCAIWEEMGMEEKAFNICEHERGFNISSWDLSAPPSGFPIQGVWCTTYTVLFHSIRQLHDFFYTFEKFQKIGKIENKLNPGSKKISVTRYCQIETVFSPLTQQSFNCNPFNIFMFCQHYKHPHFQMSPSNPAYFKNTGDFHTNSITISQCDFL
jgi:hypothetical protein